MQFTLNAKSPFNLATVTNSHGWVQLAPFSLHEDGVGFDYVLKLDDGTVVEISVTAVPDGAHITTPAELNTAAQAELKTKTAWILGTEQDFSEFYAAAAQEPKLAHVQAQAQGRLLRSATVFEDIVKTILTTNTTWAGTIRMTAGLVKAYGTPLPDDPSRCAFPTPKQLAQADMDVLQGTVKLGYRAPYVLQLAQQVASGELDVEGWKTAPSALRLSSVEPSSGQAVIPTDELRKKLLALKGIGPYAAAHMLIFLGHYDAIPVDSWALKLVSTEWFDGQPISKKDVEAAFEKWGQWQALAYWFWDWQYLHNHNE